MSNFRKSVFITAIVLSIAGPQGRATAATHLNKYSADIHAAAASACVYFRLENVSVADPTVSNSQWFALPKSHPNFDQLHALMLAANLSRRTIRVDTEGNGATACGQSAVFMILLESGGNPTVANDGSMPPGARKLSAN